MKICSATSALLLSLIVAFCHADGTIWVPMDENGYFTVDESVIFHIYFKVSCICIC